MSGQIATVEVATETSAQPSPATEPGPARSPEPGPAADTAAPPEVTLQDVLVEDVSIDGMCGVY